MFIVVVCASVGDEAADTNAVSCALCDHQRTLL